MNKKVLLITLIVLLAVMGVAAILYPKLSAGMEPQQLATTPPITTAATEPEETEPEATENTEATEATEAATEETEPQTVPAPDFTVLLHGGGNTVNTLVPYEYVSKEAHEESLVLSKQLKERCDKEGVRYAVRQTYIPDSGFGLCCAMHHLCGGVVLTYESNQGLVDAGNAIYSYDEIYKSHLLLFEEVAKHLLEKYQK